MLNIEYPCRKIGFVIVILIRIKGTSFERLFLQLLLQISSEIIQQFSMADPAHPLLKIGYISYRNVQNTKTYTHILFCQNSVVSGDNALWRSFNAPPPPPPFRNSWIRHCTQTSPLLVNKNSSRQFTFEFIFLEVLCIKSIHTKLSPWTFLC